jgi:hypothetical protein
MSTFGYASNPDHKLTAYKTDIFEVEVLLRKHIEEYLPIYGQKATISYPGIPKQCNRCYVVGHLRRECRNKKQEWIAYVVNLVESNELIKIEMVGSWQNAINRWKTAGSRQDAKE